MMQPMEGMPVALTTRNATLGDLAELLKDQHSRKLDVVAPAGAIRSENAVIRLMGTEAEISMEGITPTEGRYRPTAVADEGIAEKLGIPVAYLKKLRENRLDLYDANVNGWLHGCDSRTHGDGQRVEYGYDSDPRSFLVRCFRGPHGVEGVCRAVLSQNFRILDNLDVLTAALDGVRDTGTHVEVVGCDLTERRMYVKIAAPEIAALAPTLLRNYRSPYTADGLLPNAPRGVLGSPGHEYREDTVFAGFVISNSETGGGAFTITPRLIVRICNNGLTITKDALRNVHLGGKMEQGVIRWSESTMQKNLELVASQSKDAVQTFLDVDYVQRAIDRIEEKSTREIARPQDAIETIGKQLRFSQDRIEGVLDFFIRGGDVTAGGVMQAVTAYAQTIEDADEAFEMEAVGLKALELAAG